MELMKEEVKGYSDSREEEEEEEATTEEIITREENSSRLLHQHQDAAGSNFIINNNHHQNQNHQHNTKQLDFMDLSLGTSIDNIIEGNLQGSGGGGFSSSNVYAHHNHQHHQHASGGGSSSAINVNNNLQQQQPAEKEHMFDKVVTPSDVGKLNRLVIPKQHAEKYFPLDSSANEKGLLLNFEDRNGKLWRFRYSYWNSSQSYVMTKGWSRFVKEKKLDAGDIVSFQRGVGEMFRHRLYIDWRRRPDHHHHHHGPDPSTTLFTPFFLPNQPHLMSIRWGATSAGRLYSLPSPTPQHLNYNNTLYHHQQQQQQQQHPFHHHGGGGGSGNGSHHYNNNYHDMMSSTNTSGSGSVFYLRSTPPSMPLVVDHRQTLNSTHQQQEGGNNVSLSPMIIDSVPVAHNHHHHHHHQYQYGGKSGSSNITSTSTAGKRLRLFGVNMECASSTSEDPKCFSHVTMANSNSSLSSSSLPSPLQLLREDTTTLSSSSPSTRFGDQRGEASMLFDLDPSLQYRQ